MHATIFLRNIFTYSNSTISKYISFVKIDAHTINKRNKLNKDKALCSAKITKYLR